MQKLSHQVSVFDRFTFDPTRGCLLCGQEEIKLRPKSFEVLKYLVENNGRLISKDELIHAVWMDTAVTDDSVVQCLKDIRHALGDEAQQIIKTVPRRGYIFNAKVVQETSTSPDTTVSDESSIQPIIAAEETNGHGAVKTGALPAPERKAARMARLTAAIRQHRSAAALGVLTLAVVAAGIFIFTRPGEAIDSVAVLPFVNATGDPSQEYLSEGISNDVINSLSQLPNLKVTPFNSVMRYKDAQTDPEAIGRALGVRALVMARLIQRGDDLSIRLELIDVRDNRQLWGGKYDRKLADITTLAGDISLELSERLRLRSSSEQKQKLSRKYTQNAEAYVDYLQGHFFMEIGTESGVKRAAEFFEDAIKKDPACAPAYVGLATYYWRSGNYSFLPQQGLLQKGTSLLQKALEIDDTLAQAHAMLALYRQFANDWPAAEKEFARALELNQRDPEVHSLYARYLVTIGRGGEAITEAKRALELDPLKPGAVGGVAWISLQARQYDQAIEFFRRAIEMNPTDPRFHNNLARALVQKGMYEDAIVEFQKGIDLDSSAPGRPAHLAYALAVMGRTAEARKLLAELTERAQQRYVAPVNFAIIYAGLGEKEQAFEWLDKALMDRSGPPFIQIDPVFDSLRSDPRFVDLARRKGLAP